jgi:hypothetical protein
MALEPFLVLHSTWFVLSIRESYLTPPAVWLFLHATLLLMAK